MSGPGKQDRTTLPTATGQPSRRVRALGRLVLCLFPLAIVAGLELALRLAGVGYNPHFLVPATGESRGQLITNYAFGRRFFPRALAREPEPQGMPVAKAPRAVRIFVLGESAAMGDPDAAYGLSRMLEVILQDRLPDRPVQVVNAAMSAVNSHAVRLIAEDCLSAEADALVVYMGNNEVVGPFGIGSTLVPFSPRLPLIRLGLAVRSTRLGQVLDAIVRRTVHPGDEEIAAWRGMEHSIKEQVSATDARLEVTRRHFRQNLEAILHAARQRHVPVVLCTVPVNLRSCPPFAGKPSSPDPDPDWDALTAEARRLQNQGLADAATERLEAATRRQPAAADAWYLLGEALAQQGQAESAEDCFRKARDLDRFRFRADTAIERLIRAAGEHAGVRLVDAEARLAALEAAGTETFLDHVHLTFAGTAAMAVPASEALLETLGGAAAGEPPTADAVAERCAGALAYTDWDRRRLERDLLERRTRPPFNLQMRWQANRDEMTRLERLLRQDVLAAAARDHYAAAQRLRPRDPVLCRSAARMLSSTGDREAAARQWQSVTELQPFAPDALHNLGALYVEMGRAAEAEDLFRRALRLQPDLAEAYAGLALIRLRSGQGEAALTLLHQALAAKPALPEAHNNLAGIYIAMGRVDDALAEWRRAVALKPNYTGARCNLARALWGQGRADDALAEITAAIDSDPLSPVPRLLEADILVSLGRPNDAAERLRRALVDTSADPVLAERLRQLAPPPQPTPAGP